LREKRAGYREVVEGMRRDLRHARFLEACRRAGTSKSYSQNLHQAAIWPRTACFGFCIACPKAAIMKEVNILANLLPCEILRIGSIMVSAFFPRFVSEQLAARIRTRRRMIL